jgi:hypothetical protein
MAPVGEAGRARRKSPSREAVLAGFCVALAVICVLLALAWKREHDAVECWRAAVDDDNLAAVGECS